MFYLGPKSEWPFFFTKVTQCYEYVIIGQSPHSSANNKQ